MTNKKNDHGYMDDAVKCEYCGITTTRRDSFRHVQYPCPDMLAAQQRGEFLLRQLEQDEAGESFR